MRDAQCVLRIAYYALRNTDTLRPFSFAKERPRVNQIRLIQVGLGGWGQDWNRNILQPSNDVQLVGYVDMDSAALASAQERLGLDVHACFSTIAAALAAVEADAVLVTAALGAHVPVAQAALEAGKHVLVEKPFAPTLAEAQQLVALAAERGLALMVSQNYRFYPAVRAAAALVREGTLGLVDLVAIDFRRFANANVSMGNRHYTLTQPLLMDMAIHHFDMMRFVLGQEPQQVNCQAWNPPWSQFRDPAEAAATITFDGGAVVSYRGSWLSTGTPTPWAGAWRIECQHGEIAFTSRADRGLGDDKLVVRSSGRKTAKPAALPDMPLHDRAGSLAEFASAIREQREPASSGRDNLGSLALMLTAIASAEAGTPQQVGR